MLDLAWPNAAPYPANTTVPGGMLRLTTEGGGLGAPGGRGLDLAY